MILSGDCRAVLPTLPAESVQTCVTSPPYWGLRDYGVDGQLGLEATPAEYVDRMVEVFREVRRVLRPDGTLWLNLGDCYNAYNGGAGPSTSLSAGAQTNERPTLPSGYGLRYKGLKPKDLVGIPWRVAFALQADGWWLRSDIIWHKPNPMPESVTDRPTKAHEYLFLLTKGERYFYDAEAIAERAATATGVPNGEVRSPHGQGFTAGRSGNKARKFGEDRDRPGSHMGASVPWEGVTRNARSVWTIATRPYSEAHFATFPPDLARRCILAGSRPGDTVLDPFNGAGTTGLVAQEHGREYVGVELNPEYIAISERRLAQTTLGVA